MLAVTSQLQNTKMVAAAYDEDEGDGARRQQRRLSARDVSPGSEAELEAKRRRDEEP